MLDAFGAYKYLSDYFAQVAAITLLCHAEPFDKLRINSAKHTALGVGASVFTTMNEILRRGKALSQADMSFHPIKVATWVLNTVSDP